MASDKQHSIRANFTDISESTENDWKILLSQFVPYAKALPDRILAHLRLLDGDFGGFPVDRLTHSLQTATRAHRDGRDEEYVVCALLHDIGDTLGTYNHADIAAAILKPFFSEANHWMIQHHGIFQGYFSSTTSAWTATCARHSAATPVSGRRRHSARTMTGMHLTRRPRH